MNDVHRARRDTGPQLGAVGVVGAVCAVAAVALLLGLLAWIGAGGARADFDSRVVGIASHAATRLGSALFLSCGVLLCAFSRQHRSDIAVRVGVASVLLGAADALTTLEHVLHPHQSGSLVGTLTTNTVAVVCLVLLAPAVTAREPGPVRGLQLAAAVGGVLGLLVVINGGQLRFPGSLEGGAAAHVGLELLGATAWAALACLVLTRPGPGLSGTGRRNLSRVSALLCAGHLLTAADGLHVHLLAVLPVATRVVAAALLLRATWCALDDRARTARESQARLSAALVDAVDAAQQQERSRAQITHDARNACAGVRASLEILADHGEELDGETRARLRRVAMFGVEHIEEVIAQADPYSREFEAMEVVHRVVDGRRVLGIAVAVLGDEVRAHGRPHDVATALLNLLVNAERHAPGTQVTVDVSVRDERVRICVADNGPGVPAEQQESVFEHGWRGADSAGHGLGLHTARELMRRQGGDLTLVPSAQGAAFVMTLRAAASDFPPAPSAPEHRRTGTSERVTLSGR